MGRMVFILILSILFCSSAAVMALAKSNPSTYDIVMKRDILVLMYGYPGFFENIEKHTDGKVYLITNSGSKILYDDGIKKNFQDKLNNPDLQDMMEQIYPLGRIQNIMGNNFDPGRYRVYDLLREVYGNDKGMIEKNLTNINICGRNFSFNDRNKCAASLKSVVAELTNLTGERADIRKYVFPCGGTYNYRFISGTNRLSPHSFGIAIDLAAFGGDYWKWSTVEEGQKRLLTYPMEIVNIFERNNFIWGGKWNHFDLMHYEYRPEIILKAKYFEDEIDITKSWYSGAPLENKTIRECIEKIDSALK